MSARANQRGVTLIELVISIVIITIAVSGVLGVFSMTARQSADVMLRQQALAIGEAYLDEITLQPFHDPDPTVTNHETQRADFDDVADYNNLDNVGVRDQFDAAVAGLDGYNVHVNVTQGSLNGLPGTATWLIDITVTQPATGVAVRLSGYRTDI